VLLSPQPFAVRRLANRTTFFKLLTTSSRSVTDTVETVLRSYFFALKSR
jgi:hypothetical protein